MRINRKSIRTVKIEIINSIKELLDLEKVVLTSKSYFSDIKRKRTGKTKAGSIYNGDMLEIKSELGTVLK